MTFLLFCKYWKVELRLQEKHPEQRMIIRKTNDDIVFRADDGTEYKIDSAEITNEEHRVVSKVLDLANSIGETLTILPGPQNQQVESNESTGPTNVGCNKKSNDQTNERTFTEVATQTKDHDLDDTRKCQISITEDYLTDLTKIFEKMNEQMTRMIQRSEENANKMKTKTESELNKIATEIKTIRDDMDAVINRIRCVEEMDGMSCTDESELAEEPQIAPEDRNANMSEAVRKELLNLGVLNGSNTITNMINERPRNETIKFEIVNRDSGIKRDYKLTERMKFEHFMDYFTSELRSHNLLYVIDSNVQLSKELTNELREKQKFKVRDILINHLDSRYHLKVINIKNPVELLNKIKELKRCETNLTSVTIHKQLYNMTYNPNKEKDAEFWDRFEDVVRNYENLSGIVPLSDVEKRDAFYNSIMSAISQVQSVEFLTQSTTGKGLTYEQLKSYFIQFEANRTATTASSTTNATNTTSAMNARPRKLRKKC
ncbi:uncharacterized protein LOC105831763 [Monomorium pharaonis]|uniref:uncharacterized protein LOC105831763 n=1 Tax=Monomorium pharaonis TaxID=307658 RepID=UPI00063FBD60|nr:uncharacterized protein LOC105831763 [Monomorium pharaonis]XP_036142958.1 uncharacterized protein LOC105831763 [Monomorium pharaonis]